ncbi:MAG: membrane metalloprotease, partial [Flavobacteriales bacterium]
DKDYENENVLGLAYGTTSMAIFEKTITEYSGGISEPPRYKLEATVMNHEAGHTIGLVNNGTDMVNDHQDDAHGKHCNVENCLMYYTTRTTDVVDNLFNSNIPSLDSQCQEDLANNGGK